MSYYGNTDFLIEVAKGNISGHSIVQKFGRNLAVANATWELISNLSGTYPFPSAATTVRVKSGGNANDTVAGTRARKVRIYGLDNTLALADEEVDLAGASASSSTTTSFWRVFRGVVTEVGTYGSTNEAAIVVENTAGTADLLQINAEESQSQLCSYSIPTGYTGYLISLHVQVDASKAADIRVCTRDDIDSTSSSIKPARVRHYADGILGEYTFIPKSPAITLLEKSDIFVEAEGGGAQTEVSADFELLLVQN